MKKAFLAILSVAVILCMTCFLFTGCATVFEQYKAAMDKTNALAEIDATVDATISMSANGSSTTIPMKISMKAKDANTDHPTMLTDMETSMLGFSTKINMYYADGWEYTEVEGTKMKTQVSLEDFYKSAGYQPDQMIEFPESALKDVKFVKDGDNKKLTVKCDGSILKDQLLKSLSSAEELMSEDIKTDDMTFSDVDATVVLNKTGYISEYKVKFEVTMPGDSMGYDAPITIGIDMTIKLNNPGSSVSFDAPTDLDTYEAMDSSLQDGYTDGLEGEDSQA